MPAKILSPVEVHLPADIIRERLAIWRIMQAAILVADEVEDINEEQESERATLRLAADSMTLDATEVLSNGSPSNI